MDYQIECNLVFFVKRIVEQRPFIPQGSEARALDELHKEAVQLLNLCNEDFRKSVLGK